MACSAPDCGFPEVPQCMRRMNRGSRHKRDAELLVLGEYGKYLMLSHAGVA